jgi:hypothetical protein
MADFKTHMTVSTIAGALYGLGGYQSGMPIESCIIGCALCSVSGMLPDLDSDSGIPLREAVAFSCAIIPMLMVERFRRMGLSHEVMVVTTIIVYFLLRFVIAELFRRYTVHRGMWHSLPAAISVAIVAFLAASCDNISLRLFKSVAVFVGFMSHILLDEIWSVEFRRGRYRYKHSFGTALKLWGNKLPANLFIYALLTVLVALAYSDEGLMGYFGYQAAKPASAVQWLQAFQEHTLQIFKR